MQNKVKTAALSRAQRLLLDLGKRARTTEVAQATGVHQSQVSRLLRGQFKRVSPNVQALLAYAVRPSDSPGKPPADAGQAEVIRAALRAWDETPQGAQALVRLLRSVEAIRRLPVP